MQTLENEDLSKHVRFRIGGVAKNFYIPESREELQALAAEIKGRGERFYILGAGSNLLINDNKVFDHVISLDRMDDSIMQKEDGVFYAGASVRLQKLILTVNEAGYGGIEYLFSVPGMVGGAVVMNAGRGRKYHACISDYITGVDILSDGRVSRIAKEDCKFGYRSSIFKNSDIVVLGVDFSFPQMSKEISEQSRKERLKYAKEVQDNTKPNFGSLLMRGNSFALNILKRRGTGYKNGVHFSKKCKNWLLNEGEGTYEQTLKVIQSSGRLHRCFFCTQELEVIIWD